MTKYQKDLLGYVPVGKENALCTHRIAQNRGDQQCYETNLRDRLLRLSHSGSVFYEDRGAKGRVWWVAACEEEYQRENKREEIVK